MLLLAPLLLSSTVAAPLPAQDEELISIYVANATTFFPDPKDAGLVDALRMIDDRLAELPDEIPGFPQLPPELVQLAAHLLTGEKSVRIGMSNDPNLPFPLFGQINLMEGNEESARRIATTLIELGGQTGAPISAPGDDGLVRIGMGEVPIDIVFGEYEGDVVLSAGKLLDGSVDLSSTGLPDGVAPSYKMRMDVGKTLELVMGFAQMSGSDEVEKLETLIDAFGLSELVFEMAGGYDATSSISVMRLPGYGAVAREMGLMSKSALTAEDLAMVPVDAGWASVSTVNFEGILNFVLRLTEEDLARVGVEDPLETLAGMTGIHLQRDIIAHLGETCGMYTSQATGGGGLLSLVGFMELENAEGMRTTLQRLGGMLNELGAAQAQGYVRMKNWSRDDAHFGSLTFPGLPVPFEPTIAIAGRHLFVGLTPQAAIAAVEQSRQGGEGLLGNARFRANLPANPVGAYEVSFFDTPALLGDGYGMASLACSAIVNATRSRTDASRDAGLVMPSFHALAADARATVGVTRLVGDDIVAEYRGDRSALVNLTSSIGFISSSPLALLVPAALVLGASRQSTATMHAIEATPIEVHEDDF